MFLPRRFYGFFLAWIPASDFGWEAACFTMSVGRVHLKLLLCTYFVRVFYEGVFLSGARLHVVVSGLSPIGHGKADPNNSTVNLIQHVWNRSSERQKGKHPRNCCVVDFRRKKWALEPDAPFSTKRCVVWFTEYTGEKRVRHARGRYCRQQHAVELVFLVAKLVATAFWTIQGPRGKT